MMHVRRHGVDVVFGVVATVHLITSVPSINVKNNLLLPCFEYIFENSSPFEKCGIFEVGTRDKRKKCTDKLQQTFILQETTRIFLTLIIYPVSISGVHS